MLLAVVTGKAAVANAAIQATDFADGIDNWQSSTSTGSGGLSQYSTNLSVGYNFGSYAASTAVTGTELNPNVYLKDGTKKIQSTYSKMSETSLGFGLVKSQTADRVYPLLSTDYFDDTAPELTSRALFIAKDSSGTVTAMKILGYWSENKNLEVEILLRPSANTPGTIQTEAFVKNIGSSSASFGMVFANDTALADNDDVEVRSMGDNSGLYIEEGTYRLNTYFDVPDGPSDYTAQYWKNVRDNLNWLIKYTPANFSGTGQASSSDTYGRVLYPVDDETETEDIDSSYTLKWPYQTLKAGETSHYRLDQGITKSSYAIPAVSKTYTNESRTTGKNEVGDKLQFRVKLSNSGYNSSMGSVVFTDPLPDGLQVDPDSLTIENPDGTTQKAASSGYDSTTNTLTVPMSQNVTDGQQAYLTFDAVIGSTASGKTLTNTATVSGINDKATGQAAISAQGSVSIPVEQTPYTATLTKSVRNETTGETDFAAETTASPNDILDFRLIYQADAANTETLKQVVLKDVLAAGLTYVPGSLKVQYDTNAAVASTQTPADIDLSDRTPGSAATITFQAKFSQTVPQALTNQATVSGVNSEDKTLTTDSNSVQVNPEEWLGFDMVPSQIDFGKHNVTQAGPFTNVNTLGTDSETVNTLIVNNYTSNPKYSVNVTYDNTQNALENDQRETLSPSDGQNLMSVWQSDANSFAPITNQGTPLKRTGYSKQGVNDLTADVGAGKWQLSPSQTSQKTGRYAGKVTWTVTQSVD